MKKVHSLKQRKLASDEMRPHYDFDYSKAKPNRFAGKSKEGRLVVILDEDVAKVFTTPETSASHKSAEKKSETANEELLDAIERYREDT